MWLLGVVSALTGCGSLIESSKYQFSDGVYRAKIGKEKKARVYVQIGEDSIDVVPVTKEKGELALDTAQSLTLSYPETINGNEFDSPLFVQTSFDLDVLTIPFKYRLPTANVPNQLTAHFTGAAYLGYRSDLYRLSYQKAPLVRRKRTIRHYGYSFGGFAGLGATTVNSLLTDNHVTDEYEGVVFTKGIAGIIAVNNFTFGLGIGLDHLLDRNRSVWIYQGKPWFGLTFGLNLN
jgi:hypothetical protein